MLPKKPLRKRSVYLDASATSHINPEVLLAMNPFLNAEYGNPSALYKLGVDAKDAVSASRKSIAHMLHAQQDTITFTSGGTESTNMAILGVARKHVKKGKHIITTKIEHSAVLNPMKHLESLGFDITYLDVDAQGRIDTKQCREALRDDTILVSIMHANNEIGVINPIADIGREILKFRKQHNTEYPYFHTDACQAASTLDIDVEKSHVDLMTINASKINGPKGVGVLYKRRGVEIEPLVFGGGQESGLRSGTENVPGIVGMSKALESAQAKKLEIKNYIQDIRNYFWERMSTTMDDVILLGPDVSSDDRLVFNLAVSFPGVDADALVLYLDEYGIMCSKGSACNTNETEASHVLRALGCKEDVVEGSIRFSLTTETGKKDIDYVMKFLPELVATLRN